MIKKFGEYLPALSVFVILVGILKLNVYYQNFHVPIKYYFGVSEIGVFISQDFFYVLFTLLGYIIITLNDAENVPATNSNTVKKNPNLYVGITLTILVSIGYVIAWNLSNKYY